LHGTADQATKPSGSQRFYDAAGSRDKTLKLYNGHFHDLLNDLDKEIVMADIKNWIVGRLRGCSSAHTLNPAATAYSGGPHERHTESRDRHETHRTHRSTDRHFHRRLHAGGPGANRKRGKRRNTPCSDSERGAGEADRRSSNS